MILNVSREQIKDRDQLRQIRENLKTAKTKRQVIVARTS
jgi:HSP90 family molecular chaperone